MGNVLVACEYSGAVRRAFAAQGHTVLSVDLLPAEDGAPGRWELTPAPAGRHHVGPVEDILAESRELDWDLMVAFPPCTHLAVSGARWFPAKRADGRQQAALEFVGLLLDADVPRIALENPVSIISSHFRKPDQTVQPWQFGSGTVKRTCLWLKDLPLLTPTDIVDGREERVWRMGPSPDRWRERSRTVPGIAQAMADQWGPLL